MIGEPPPAATEKRERHALRACHSREAAGRTYGLARGRECRGDMMDSNHPPVIGDGRLGARRPAKMWRSKRSPRGCALTVE